MADFSSDIPGFIPSFTFLDPNFQPINHFSGINQNLSDNSSLNTFLSFLPFSRENFFVHNNQAIVASEFPGNLAEHNSPDIFHRQSNQNVIPVASHQTIANPGIDQSKFLESKKRKAMMGGSETSSLNSSPQVSDNGKGSACNSRKGKRAKSKENDEKPKEVVHVRARRGQATDSHSLAERVRRGKINERLRCLQDIVPGCYKTMGMAVMLEEIINYVQSLQNQVEFLSMKLTAASTFYDFNSEADPTETIQRAKAQEAKEIEKMVKEGYGVFTNFHPTCSL